MAETGKKFNVFIPVCAGLLGLLALTNFLWFAAWRGRSVVTAVPDGDSLDLADGRRIRLLGLDAPERARRQVSGVKSQEPDDDDTAPPERYENGSGGCLWKEARDRLVELAVGKRVILKDTVKDDYGRILANVWTEGGGIMRQETGDKGQENSIRRILGGPIPAFTGMTGSGPGGDFVNEILVREGLAKYRFASSSREKILSYAHSYAMTNKLGIYSSRCRQTVPLDNCAIKGNVKNSIKTYLTPGCPNYEQTIIDLSYGDRWFCTEEEATSAGFMKGRNCK